ncbi:flagellar hook-associated family protein [Phyllobacterium salinisoli]|uniref:Flagellin n=1 Tax=Phyllobacterium salinisoli TaxID=1899321 RepID=A0A368K3N4_9HYPH|nr:flagellar hook-associated family protein [Phyllobacterium salinisoli]RCS23989.1 flagellar hook-associated family protein [Phyllobacterium salinisoli]
MKAQSVSSYALSNALRSVVSKAQTELLKAQQEATTGTVFDVGLALGARSGQTISLRKEYDRLSSLTEMNNLISQRMRTSQTAIGSVIGQAQNFLANLAGATSTVEGKTTIVQSAKSALQTTTGLLNSSYAGEFIFAGVNTDVKPLGDYFGDGSTARSAVQEAFENHFGFATDAPQVAGISASDMEAFLGTAFAAEFSEANWSSNWSSASSTVIKSRIAPTELTETSVSANAEGFRKVAMSFTMVAELGDIGLNDSAFSALINKALGTTTEAITAVSQSQSALGIAQARTTNANTRIAAQINILNSSVRDLEAVDPYEAATRVSALMSQIETSYAMTTRLMGMSLLNYLK